MALAVRLKYPIATADTGEELGRLGAVGLQERVP